MSDFLDRLAARAIGSAATALAPRLPSLFEPLPYTPILPTVDDGMASIVRHVARSTDETPPVAAPPRPPRALSPATVDALHTAPVGQAATRMPAPTAASVPECATPATVRAAPPATPPSTMPAVARRVASQPEPAHAEPATASPMQPRQTRIAPPPASAAPPPHGTLLPPAPVFVTPRIEPAREQTGHAAAIRPRAAAATGRSATASEPVVHVSIGRLEVRAAPADASAPRRRDQPRPSSLDDYLRQRGGKAPP